MLKEVQENNMTISLGSITFENDIYQTDLPDGSIIVLNKINESLKTVDDVYETVDVDIKRINIEIISLEGQSYTCPCVIGLGNDRMQITTRYSQLEGLLLTEDNLQYCEVEIYEQQ